MAKINYDADVDALYVRKVGEPISFSFSIMQNFVLDVDAKRRIVGLEVLNASKVLNIPKKELEDIKSGNVSTVMSKEIYGARFSLITSKAKIESQIALPASAAFHGRR